MILTKANWPGWVRTPKYNPFISMKKSAGLLLYRRTKGITEYFLVHPGGPLWKNKDEGAWSIPKGEFDGEEPLAAAQREFFEETGVQATGHFEELKPVRQKSGKWVYAWSCEMDVDEKKIHSNTFPLEWPPKSGKFIEVAEVDKAGWFDAKTAKVKINPAQMSFIQQVENKKATN